MRRRRAQQNPEDGTKVEVLERILRSLTHAEEIRWYMGEPENPNALWGYIELVGADPRLVKLGGCDDEGLELDFDAEVYEEDLEGLVEPFPDARIVVNVWIGIDPWKRIRELEESLKDKKPAPE